MTTSRTNLISRIRRSHGLEHATVHTLARDNRSLKVVGRSDWDGFTIYGDVAIGAVRRAAREALVRLRRGEPLTVHPRCGTRTSVALLLSFAAMEGAGRLPSRSRLARIGALVLGVVSALVIARPLGLIVQREVTTSSDMEGVRIADVTRVQAGDIPVHRVHLAFDQ